MTTEFLDALAAGMPPDERLILCGFGGDPAQAAPDAWRPRPWSPGGRLGLGPRANAYVTVGSFRQAADGSWRRRTETFAAGRALMVDDVGVVGAGSAKVEAARVAGVPPSARVRTSPNNEQWWYFLDPPETDALRFDGVIRAFIAGRLLGLDPGMSGITRVGRVPGFVNAKPAYGGAFPVELLELNAHRYSTDALLAGFGLEINGRRLPAKKLISSEARVRNRAFLAMYQWLEQRGMLKRAEPDLSGWTEMTCPWVAGHTGGSDTGAAIREPSLENDYYGAFRCHHGHCLGFGWRQLTDWINEQSVEELDDINNNEQRKAA